MKWERIGPAQLVLLAVALIGILVFIQTRVVSADLHNRRQDLLLQLERAESQLDRDIDSVVSFRLVQYDPLVTYGRRIRSLVQQLGSAQLALPNRVLLDAYLGTLKEKLDLMERIKSEATQVRNGLHYLPAAVAEMRERNAPAGRQIAALLNVLLHYHLFAGAAEAGEIFETIEEVQVFSEVTEAERPLFDRILFHLRANLRLVGELAELRNRYAMVPSGERFDALYRDYTDAYARQSGRAEVFSMVLLLVVVALFIGLGGALHALYLSRRRTEQAHDQLRSAVESLSDAFALFTPDGRLILHNRKYPEFYPWLEEALRGTIYLDDIHRRHAESGRFLTAADEPSPQLPCTGARSYTEQLSDGRWYLASDAYTAAGELVCVRADITESKRTELQLRKLYRALEQSPTSVVITDTKGDIEYVNPKFEEITGYAAAEVLGQNPRILKSGDKSPEQYKELWDTIKAGKVWRGKFHNKRKDGEIFWEAASISPVRDSDGAVTHFIAIKEDITAQKRAEDQLRMNATVFETTTEGIMVTDADNRIKTVNPAFTRITGYLPEEVIGRNPSLLGSGRHGPELFDAMWSSLRQKGHWSGEIWNRHKDGTVFPEWMSLAAIRHNGSPVQEYVAVFSDITQRKQDEEQIRHQANYDALTGLPNRTLLFDRLGQAVAGARRDHWIVALLFLDLDRFKAVNDSMGHVVGDELLQQVAGRLRGCVREVDTVGRFGGDEFVIILDDLKQADDAAEVAKKVIDRLHQPFLLAEREVFIGTSIGITLFPDDSSDASGLLRNADMAMYRAKGAGRNNYQFFTPDMDKQVQQRMALEQDLRLAVERSELSLRYQPIVTLPGGGVIGMEALLYWRHPQRGLVAPGIFIPLAEEAGLIGAIGRWVLQQACLQAGAWRNSGLELQMSVNVSSYQLTSELGVEELEELLAQNGLDPSGLMLEITEGMMLDGGDATLSWLEQTSALGIGLAVDEFGTGCASLSHLKRFPVDTLKIDRSFLRGLPGATEDAALVEAIFTMARGLGLRVVAAGVETHAQLAFVQELGCKMAQGHLFSRPVAAEQVPELARRFAAPHHAAAEANEAGGEDKAA